MVDYGPSAVCQRRGWSVRDVGGLSETSGVCQRRRDSVNDFGRLSRSGGWHVKVMGGVCKVLQIPE